ncbi:unnamed protein product [marine sediment metagenome]|uniref:Uncharacterized protein n=1 Tax=marine sediment metagenome TaxID=412755 RepID=X1AGB3_9ZZZZ
MYNTFPNMTLKEIRSLIQFWSGDVSGEMKSDFYDVAINKSQDKFAELGLIMGKWAKCNAVGDQQDYQLYSYVLKLLRVYVYDSDNSYYKPIPSIEIAYLDKTNPKWRSATSQTVPDYYYLEGRRLGFYPMFDDDVTTGIMIDFLRKGTSLSADAHESLIPSQHHHYLAMEAFILLFPDSPRIPAFRDMLKDGYSIMRTYTTEQNLGIRNIIQPRT